MKSSTCGFGTTGKNSGACVESLEPRRLLAAQLSFNSAGGLLTFTQQSGVDDSLEVFVSATHFWFFDDASSSILIDVTLAGGR